MVPFCIFISDKSGYFDFNIIVYFCLSVMLRRSLLSCSKQRLIASPKRSFAVSLEGYGDHLFKGINIPIRKLFLIIFARESSFYKFFMFD